MNTFEDLERRLKSRDLELGLEYFLVLPRDADPPTYHGIKSRGTGCEQGFSFSFGENDITIGWYNSDKRGTDRLVLKRGIKQGEGCEILCQSKNISGQDDKGWSEWLLGSDDEETVTVWGVIQQISINIFKMSDKR